MGFENEPRLTQCVIYSGLPSGKLLKGRTNARKYWLPIIWRHRKN